jgi:hypothetical protein
VPKGAHKGDDAILHLPDRGLAARAIIRAEPEKARPGRYGAPVGEIVLLNVPVPLAYLRKNHPAWKWPYYPKSYATINGQIEMRLEELIKGYSPKETEGGSKSVLLTVYERNPTARRQCLDHYGTDCSGCGISFGKIYGESAEGYIHVHHVKGVSSRGGKYVVDPVKDLRPICPNCHAVVHRQSPPLTIMKLKNMLKESARIR